MQGVGTGPWEMMNTLLNRTQEHIQIPLLPKLIKLVAGIASSLYLKLNPYLLDPGYSVEKNALKHTKS